jgi:molybdenum cofactor cytidylyltransferase/nicotine blue oxidoreductase
MRVTTIVLAAGEGERLGGPKALLAWRLEQGERRPGAEDAAELPLALAHAAVRRASESARVVVVVRAAVAEVLAREARRLAEPPEIVVSEAPAEAGPAGSIGCAVARLAEGELDGDRDVVLVTPVDVPPARPDTVVALVRRLEHDGALLAARPAHAGRSGHPVALRIAPLLRHYGPRVVAKRPLRTVLAGMKDAVANVVVADADVLADLDTGDTLAARGLAARFIR